MTITQEAIAELRSATLPDESAMLNYAECQAILALVLEVERLREALAFYADERRYKSADLSKDRGALARSSLPQPTGE